MVTLRACASTRVIRVSPALMFITAVVLAVSTASLYAAEKAPQRAQAVRDSSAVSPAKDVQASSESPSLATAADGAPLSLVEEPLLLEDITVVGRGASGPESQPVGPPLRGTICGQSDVTYSSANFNGGEFVLQAGLVEGEMIASSFSVTPDDLPLRLDLIETVFATQDASDQTTTGWSLLIWEGTPDEGAADYIFIADGFELQPIQVGPGTDGALLQVSVDPGDPEQIIITQNACSGNDCVFTVGFRVDDHNQPATAPCLLPQQCCPPPSNLNAFPTTDTMRPSLANDRDNNWLYCLPGCTLAGFGCGGGWHRFNEMDSAIEPGGDWNIRISYTSLNCESGACCMPDGSCTEDTGDNCVAAGGSFQGNLTTCGSVSCPQPMGACCSPFGCEEQQTEAQCDTVGGTVSFDMTCAEANCPEFEQACCFNAEPPSCSDLLPSVCAAFDGLAVGPTSQCATTDCFVTGACCLADGGCADDMFTEDCEAQGGTYWGDNTVCAQVDCPQPDGACCVDNSCAPLTEAQCLPIPNATWLGAFTDCELCSTVEGACCRPTGCTQTTPTRCASFVCSVLDYLGPPFSGCFGDLDGNGVVTPGDRGFISANLGETDDVLICLYDLNGDGAVSVQDRGFVSANVGVCEPLPDFQNGSGLNGGVPDFRYDGFFVGTEVSCEDANCAP